MAQKKTTADSLLKSAGYIKNPSGETYRKKGTSLDGSVTADSLLRAAGYTTKKTTLPAVVRSDKQANNSREAIQRRLEEAQAGYQAELAKKRSDQDAMWQKYLQSTGGVSYGASRSMMPSGSYDGEATQRYLEQIDTERSILAQLDAQEEYQRLLGLDLEEVSARLEQARSEQDALWQNYLAGTNGISWGATREMMDFDLAREIAALEQDLEQGHNVQWRADKAGTYAGLTQQPDFEENSDYRRELDQSGTAYTGVNFVHTGALQYITNEERKTYNYLYNTQGAKAAEDYYTWLEYTLNERRQSARSETASEAAQGVVGGVVSSAVSVPTSLVSGVGAIDLALQRLQKGLSGDDTPLDFNTTWQDPYVYTTAVRGTVGENLNDVSGTIDEDVPVLGGKGLGDLYQVGMSMADSASIAALSYATGIPLSYTSALLGGAAATSSMQNAHARGVSDDQALVTGLLSGTAEMFFEQVSLDRLLKLESGTLTQTLKNIASQGFVEGSEEFFTTAANTITDCIVNGDKAELMDTYQRFLNQGFSASEAAVKTFGEALEGAAADFLGGMISGGTMVTLQSGYNAVVDRKSSRKSDGEAVTITGIESPTDSESPVTVKVKASDGTVTTLPQSEVELSEQTAQLIQEASKYGEDAPTMFAAAQEGQNLEDYAGAWEVGYTLGQEGGNQSALKQSGYYEEFAPQMDLAFDQGTRRRVTALSPKGNTVSMDGTTLGGKTYGAVQEHHLSSQQKAAVETIRTLAQAGVLPNVVLYESAEADWQTRTPNGAWDPNTSTMYIDVNAWRSGEDISTIAVMNTVSHELTHTLEGTQEYDVLREFVLYYISEEQQSAIRTDLELLGYTEEQVEAEMVANACELVLRDSKIVRQLIRQNRTLAERVRDFLHQFVAKLKAAYGESRGKTKEARALQEQMETLVALWDQALLSRLEQRQDNKKTAPEGGEAAYSLGRYSQHQKDNWADSKTIIIYQDEAQLCAFIQDALNGVGLHRKMYFGTIPAALAERVVQETGMEIAGYNCTLRASEIRKIIADHGNARSESDRGQRAITIDDLIAIPDIIQAPDEIRLSDKLFEGKPVLEFVKTIDGRTTVASYVSRKHHDLTVQTMYSSQKKRNLATAADEQASANTPEAHAGTVPVSTVSQSPDGVKQQFSLQDSAGNELTQAQADYFQDSVVRDENGDLLVMYHGSRKGGFTVFKDWAYMTADPAYARRYTGDEGSMYETYVKVTKPFDTRIPEVRRLWEEEFFGNYSRTPLQETGLPDWTDGYDLAEWIEEEGLDYDGILLDEGADPTEDGGVAERGISYVVRHSDQIKRTDNKSPTGDGDIRYSLRDYSEVEKKQHAQDAIQFFGRTFSWKETGFLTTDGKKLDFSGKHNGGQGGYRTVDHRDIRDALGEEYGGDDYSGAMVQFMQEGNIRISPECNGINLSVMPTKAQIEALTDYISRARGEVILDIDDRNGNTVASIEYPRGTRSARVVEDIRQYFEDGIVPEETEMMYSLRTTEEGTNFVRVDVDQSRFDGLTTNEMAKEAKRVILEKFRGRVIGRDYKAYVSRKTSEEYSHPANRRNAEEAKQAKLRASTELDNMISASQFLRNEPQDGRHPEAVGGFDKLRTRFVVGEHAYEGEISVMVTARGNLFYDVTKIKDITGSTIGRAMLSTAPESPSDVSTTQYATDPEKVKSDTGILSRRSFSQTDETLLSTLDPNTLENQAERDAYKAWQSKYEVYQRFNGIWQDLQRQYDALEQKDSKEGELLLRRIEELGKQVERSLERVHSFGRTNTVQRILLREQSAQLTRELKGSQLTREQRGFLTEIHQALRTLQRENDTLRRELKPTTDRTAEVQRKALDKLSRELTQGTALKGTELRYALGELSDYLLHGEGDWYTALEQARGIAETLVENADYADFDALHPAVVALRGTTVRLPESLRSDAIALGLYQRARAVGVRLSYKTGRNLEDILQETPYLTDDTMSLVDQLDELIAQLEGVAMVNPYGSNDRELQLSTEAMATYVLEQVQQLNGLARAQTTKADQMKKRAEKMVKQVKAHNQEQRQKASQRRQASELRRRILRHTKDLAQKLLRPTDTRHIPEELRTTVARLLESINQESLLDNPEHITQRTLAFVELRNAVENILRDEGSDLVIDPQLVGDLTAITGYKNTPLGAMDLEQLNKIWRALRAVEGAITNAGKTLAGEKYERISQWAQAFQTDTASRREKHGLTERHPMLSMETPLTFFTHFGDAGKAVFRMLRNAQDAQQTMTDALVAELEGALDHKQGLTPAKLRQDIKTFRFAGGELTLGADQRMELYLLAKRPQARDHILHNGIMQPKVGRTRRKTKATLVTIDDLMVITGSLTGEQVALADRLQGLMGSRLAAWGNETSMRAYGYRKFGDPNYWPIRTAREQVHSKEETKEGNTISIKNYGMAKPLVQGANNAVDLPGVFNTFSRHATEMIIYAAWLCPMEDANRLFNWRYTEQMEEEGQLIQVTRDTVKGLLDRVAGDGGRAYWSKLMSDIQNGIHGDSTLALPARLMGNAKAAAVGSNLRVILQQPTSIFRTLTLLTPGELSAGFLGGATKGGGFARARKYSPIASRKAYGSFDIYSGTQMQEVLFDDKRVIKRTTDALSWGAAKADRITWGYLWNVCERKIARDQKALKPGSDAFYEQVNRLFTEIIDETQVVDGVLQRSQIMRSKSDLDKMATAFMGEPTMSLNVMLRAADQFLYEQDADRRKITAGKVVRAAGALLITAAVNGVVKSLVDAMRDDDKDREYWERFFAAFSGIDGDESGAMQQMFNIMFTGNMASDLNPINQIPYLKDVVSLFQGYDVSRADMDGLADLLSKGELLVRTFSGESGRTMAYALKEFANQAAKLAGISVGNILRDVWVLCRTISTGSDHFWVEYQMEKAIYALNDDRNQSRYMNILYRAWTKDRTQFDMIYEDMVTSGGYAEGEIGEAMVKRAASALVDDTDRGLDITEDAAYAQALVDAGIIEADDLGSKLLSGLFDEADEDEIDLYELWLEDQNAYDTVVEKYVEYGLFEEEDADAKLWRKITDDDSYMSSLSDRELISLAKSVGGKTADAAEDYVALYRLEIEYPDYAERLTASSAGYYAAELESLSISLDTFCDLLDYNKSVTADVDANGNPISGSKKEKLLVWIDRQRLNTRQKDALYRYFGWAESKLEEAPWH